MQCPFDANELTVVNRSGVEIDWCPSCKGVWLERGELDKLIDLAAASAPQLQPPAPAPAPVAGGPEPGYQPPPAYQQPPEYQQPPQYQRPPERRYNDGWPDDMYDRDSSDRTYRTGRKHKRKGLLGDIFDF